MKFSLSWLQDHLDAPDIVVVDNSALVHGRNAFRGNSSRHLQRMQII